MNSIMKLAKKHDIFVVEDAAQAIDSHYKDKALGSIGHLATFSFHETKNIISGEGGLLAINDNQFIDRAEIIWEKGTNRSAFFRGEIDKYGWVDIGSSFLPSEVIAAFLWAQLETLEKIQTRRKALWNQYYNGLVVLENTEEIKLAKIPEYATNNAHLFFVICKSIEERSALIQFLKQKNIHAVFHYLSLHNSTYYNAKHDGRQLIMSDTFSNTLLRLPFYYELSESDANEIIKAIKYFYEN
ncbi:UNVERIFIED_CONTAM: hypothetical protein GTU68_019260 [Idotea baltica]|nr:hypothetical protein [Idotea baltica]